MQPILIHPTHRKYIRLLRKRAESGDPVILTSQDKDDFSELFKNTQQRLKRHQGLYHITLRAMERPRSAIRDDEVYAILDSRIIDIMAGFLAKAERGQFGTTLFSAFVVPLLRKVIRWIDRRERKHSR